MISSYVRPRRDKRATHHHCQGRHRLHYRPRWPEYAGRDQYRNVVGVTTHGGFHLHPTLRFSDWSTFRHLGFPCRVANVTQATRGPLTMQNPARVPRAMGGLRLSGPRAGSGARSRSARQSHDRGIVNHDQSAARCASRQTG